ncbi:FAD-binding protein [Gracilibacillus thailandensis]|uniref:FAD-binding protein n=1 Tax=Gracilibacillus thailandensis TaxID=563735 RepID=A0A6N7R6F0_9BACI|nr:FAD-binding protein [Gracilibacillus thailandensis]MRI68795.1 FAD-binding protein [Gracilibacillus thailandensis]
MNEQKNWAGNYTYSAANWHEPESVNQLQQLVRQCDKLRVVGSRHSFNGIADSSENMVSLQKMNKIIALDRDNQTVTVEGGIIYSDLSRFLQENGFALENMASLPHISVVGACATATHGSGDRNSCLSDSVHAMEVVTADGELVQFSREENQEQLKGAVVGLGGIGIVTKMTLDIIPAFQISQYVYEQLPLAQLEHHFDDIFSSAYSVSLFTNWQSDTINQVWLKQLHTEENEPQSYTDLYGAKPATDHCHPIAGIEAINCTEQMGIPGPWYDRLPHFRIDFTPSSGDELQSEYIIPRQYAYKALTEINKIRDQIAPLLHVCEIRSIAKDELWMSPCYQQDSIGIHLTWKDDWESVQKVLPQIEEKLTPYHARPHWGKLFTMTKEQVQPLYEKLPDFQQLLEHYDPKGKFRNEFINTYIFDK